MQPLTHLKVPKSYLFFTCWYRSHFFLISSALPLSVIINYQKSYIHVVIFVFCCSLCLSYTSFSFFCLFISFFCRNSVQAFSLLRQPSLTIQSPQVPSEMICVICLHCVSTISFTQIPTYRSREKNRECNHTGVFNPWIHQLSVASPW